MISSSTIWTSVIRVPPPAVAGTRRAIEHSVSSAYTSSMRTIVVRVWSNVHSFKTRSLLALSGGPERFLPGAQ